MYLSTWLHLLPWHELINFMQFQSFVPSVLELHDCCLDHAINIHSGDILCRLSRGGAALIQGHQEDLVEELVY